MGYISRSFPFPCKFCKQECVIRCHTVCGTSEMFEKGGRQLLHQIPPRVHAACSNQAVRENLETLRSCVLMQQCMSMEMILGPSTPPAAPVPSSIPAPVAPSAIHNTDVQRGQDALPSLTPRAEASSSCEPAAGSHAPSRPPCTPEQPSSTIEHPYSTSEQPLSIAEQLLSPTDHPLLTPETSPMSNSFCCAAHPPNKGDIPEAPPKSCTSMPPTLHQDQPTALVSCSVWRASAWVGCSEELSYLGIAPAASHLQTPPPLGGCTTLGLDCSGGCTVCMLSQQLRNRNTQSDYMVVQTSPASGQLSGTEPKASVVGGGAAATSAQGGSVATEPLLLEGPDSPVCVLLATIPYGGDVAPCICICGLVDGQTGTGGGRTQATIWDVSHRRLVSSYRKRRRMECEATRTLCPQHCCDDVRKASTEADGVHSPDTAEQAVAHCSASCSYHAAARTTTSYQAAPHSTTSCQAAPHSTTSYQAAPHSTTSYQAAPHSTTSYQAAPFTTTKYQAASRTTTSCQVASGIPASCYARSYFFLGTPFHSTSASTTSLHLAEDSLPFIQRSTAAVPVTTAPPHPFSPTIYTSTPVTASYPSPPTCPNTSCTNPAHSLGTGCLHAPTTTMCSDADRQLEEVLKIITREARQPDRVLVSVPGMLLVASAASTGPQPTPVPRRTACLSGTTRCRCGCCRIKPDATPTTTELTTRHTIVRALRALRRMGVITLCLLVAVPSVVVLLLAGAVSAAVTFMLLVMPVAVITMLALASVAAVVAGTSAIAVVGMKALVELGCLYMAAKAALAVGAVMAMVAMEQPRIRVQSWCLS